MSSKRSETTYQKINTIFKRDDNNIIMPFDELTQPEFEYLRNLKWHCEEKVDGCLKSNTLIQMADGTRKQINKIKEGDYVLGYDVENGEGVKVVKVQGVKKQKSAGTWVIVKTTRNGLDKGNWYGQICCTFDHKIYTKNRGYVEAYSLTKDDTILNVRNDISLTPIQEQILIGKMLGDGTLRLKKMGSVGVGDIQWGQKEKEYTEWCLKGINEVGRKNISEKISGYGTTIYRASTKMFPSIYNKFNNWIDENGKKEVPNDICLTPISIAFWYMDDGVLTHTNSQEDRVRFATNGFNENSCKILQRELAKFGIESTIADYKGNTICLNAENAERMFLLIHPYICNCKKYKLPERYRKCEAYLISETEQQYHNQIAEQRVISIEKDEHKHERWDIQTETHNFFTTGGLVHNTNIRIEMTNELLHDDTFEPYSLHFEVKYKGKTDNANVAGDLIETLKRQYPADKVAKAFGYDEYIGIDRLEDFGLKIVKDEKEGLKIFKTNGNPLPNKIVIYGEGYGAGIQSGGYYRKDKAFIMFDVAVDGKYLTIEQRNEIGVALDADMVPFIGDMTIDEAIEFVKKGFDSRIASETHPAEGLVVRPMTTLYGRNGERIITKIKTCDFADYFKKYGTYDKVEQKTNKFLK